MLFSSSSFSAPCLDCHHDNNTNVKRDDGDGGGDDAGNLALNRIKTAMTTALCGKC